MSTVNEQEHVEAKKLLSSIRYMVARGSALGNIEAYIAEVLKTAVLDKDAEIARLRSALQEAEHICDGLRGDADQIGELIFGDHIPDANGNERFSADGWVAEPGNPDDFDVPAYTEMSIETAREVAALLNEMLDSEWVDVDGSRQDVGGEDKE